MTRTERRRQEALLHATLLVGDFVSFFASFLVAYVLRFYSGLTLLIPVTKGYPPFMVYLFTAFFVGVVGVLVFHVRGLYRPSGWMSWHGSAFACAKAVTLALLGAATVAFFYRGVSLSRAVFLLSWVLAVVAVPLLRKFALHIYLTQNLPVATLIIGHTPSARRLAQLLKMGSIAGYTLAGVLEESSALGLKDGFARELGTRSLETVEALRPDLVVVSAQLMESEGVEDLFPYCHDRGIDTAFLVDVPDQPFTRARIVDMGGVHLLESRDFPLLGWNFLLKGVLDFLLAGVFLVILSPLFLLAAIVIKVDSRGPVFFKQERMGLDGKSFLMWKFRSMVEDAERSTGPVWAKDRDPRRTRVGRLMRKISIDELPQLINVLRGEMSIVGPRPERPVFVQEFRQMVSRYWERHRVKAGITGWAQVNGLRGNTPLEQRIKYDLEYIENWSLWFDFKIMVRTLGSIISPER